jgi:hypothetical protein
VEFTPHPFHRGPLDGLSNVGVLLFAQRSFCANTCVVNVPINIPSNAAVQNRIRIRKPLSLERLCAPLNSEDSGF